MNSQKTMIVLCVMCVVFLTSSCNSEAPTNLNFRITWDVSSGRGEVISEVVHQFNNSQESIGVTILSGNEDKALVLDSLMHTDTYVYVLPYRYLQDEDIAEQLLPLNDQFESTINEYHENLVPLSYMEEDLLGIPWIGHSMALIYNKDMVKACGVDPGQWQTLEDMLEGVARVDGSSDASGIGLVGADHHDLSWMTAQFIYSFGGALAEVDNEGNSQILINSPETKEGLEFYINGLGQYAQQGWENHDGSDVLEAFCNEEVAFEIQGPWAVSDIWKKGNPFSVGVIALSDFGLYSEVGPMMLAISKSCEDVEKAEEFIEYMIQKDHLNQIMTGEYIPKYGAYYPFRVPIHKEANTNEFFERYPDFYPFIEGFNMPSISTPTSQWAEIQNTQYTTLIHDVIVGERALDDVLEEIGK